MHATTTLPLLCACAGLDSQVCSCMLCWQSGRLTVAHMQFGPVHCATHSLKVSALLLVVSGLRDAFSLMYLQQAIANATSG
jgi:hypothetical protein